MTNTENVKTSKPTQEQLDQMATICSKTQNPLICHGKNNETGNVYRCALIKDCKKEYRRRYGS